MTQLVRNICALIALPAQPADRIELIPVGLFKTADSRHPGFNLDDPAAVIARSFDMAPGKVLPIDFDHRSFAEQGKADSRAAGWITSMVVDGDRIMASVEWTAEGRSALENRSYRFVSPVFKNLPSGKVVAIEGAGLVNNPALPQLRQLASKEIHMEPIALIAAALGIDADKPDDIVARVTALATAETQLASITTAAKVSGADAVTQICARLNAAAPDPSQFVPKATFDHLQTQFASLQTTVNTALVETALEKARDEGKLTPDMDGWATQLASKDLAEFEAWAKVAPVRVDIGGTRQLANRKLPDKAEITSLNAEQRQVASQLGIPHDKFLASLQADLKKDEQA